MEMLGDIHEYLADVALFVKSRGINFAEFPNTAKTYYKVYKGGLLHAIRQPRQPITFIIRRIYCAKYKC